jgi:hypothetical protein
MIAKTDEGRYRNIVCDRCDAEAPPASEIIAAHGLVNMGWRCGGGTHICPVCVKAEDDAARND